MATERGGAAKETTEEAVADAEYRLASIDLEQQLSSNRHPERSNQETELASAAETKVMPEPFKQNALPNQPRGRHTIDSFPTHWIPQNPKLRNAV